MAQSFPAKEFMLQWRVKGYVVKGKKEDVQTNVDAAT